MNATTPDLTPETIRAWRDEAGAAGDLAMVGLCDLATDGRATGMGALALLRQRRTDLRGHKYADPTEGERDVVDVDDARAIVDEDPSLLWVDGLSREDALVELAQCEAQARADARE